MGKMRNLICCLILFFFGSSCKQQPTIKHNKELLTLEKNIREETLSTDHTYINEILENDLKNCNAKLYIYGK
ncbi:hypothetical protein BWK59_14915 [Flavobacterium davisii]|uniref:Lipoprotein n=2 Tax=Flavobacterium davisii TaxID=2906077 RepID=A0A2D0AI79_9FLAO|nr:hypothetical protein BWK59_14915 [Flavobacterium davisii]